MGQNIVVTGMVLNVMPIGDYDKRITLLTRERGKITAFARGARKPGSQFLAATNPFSFGEFELFEGRSSYSLAKTTIQNYFRELAMDYEAAYYGFYFLEFAEYYCQENLDETQMLKLLYQSLRALESKKFDKRLVRVIYELKAMSINGEGPNVFSCFHCGSREGLAYFSVARGGIFCRECGKLAGKDAVPLAQSTLYTMQFILSSPVEKLFTFKVSEDVLSQLEHIMKSYTGRYIEHTFKSLKIFEEITG
jgi:DNA repair protein RecO (recombination protein O)